MDRFPGRTRTERRTLGVRLGEIEHLRLEMIASHLGVPKASLARDLLGAATQEALDSVKFRNADEEADFWSEYAEREREVIEGMAQDYVDYERGEG